MKIKIIDPFVCENCNIKSCKFLTVSSIKEDFIKLTSETTICPTSAIDENGPLASDLKSAAICSESCVKCGLCAKFCAHKNLVIECGSSQANEFVNLDAIQLKAVTSLYLSILFDFAANTNRNQALPFDCYVSTGSGAEAFVEIDAGDDSLECLRRILGDIVMFSQTHPISNGIIVLSSLPKIGSRDIFSVLAKMKEFPTTRKLNVYITTFSDLRMLCLAGVTRVNDFKSVLFDCSNETQTTYESRIRQLLSKATEV